MHLVWPFLRPARPPTPPPGGPHAHPEQGIRGRGPDPPPGPRGHHPRRRPHRQGQRADRLPPARQPDLPGPPERDPGGRPVPGLRDAHHRADRRLPPGDRPGLGPEPARRVQGGQGGGRPDPQDAGAGRGRGPGDRPGADHQAQGQVRGVPATPGGRPGRGRPRARRPRRRSDRPPTGWTRPGNPGSVGSGQPARARYSVPLPDDFHLAGQLRGVGTRTGRRGYPRPTHPDLPKSD
ncbi:MAG: hypothetical protein JWO38_1548 [Gemmataceae bacterium]|nr:hypothetical protein [Gemmataceae bacterium]